MNKSWKHSSAPTLSRMTPGPANCRRNSHSPPYSPICAEKPRAHTTLQVPRRAPAIHTGMTQTAPRPEPATRCGMPASNVASSPPRCMAVASSTASVIWRYPRIRATISSGNSTTERSRGQNECLSSRLSFRSTVIASAGVTVRLTAAGLQETRMNPASVKGQVAQPVPRRAANHDRAAT